MAHIYVDDNTGRYYIWDGSKFVEYKNETKPQIGDRPSDEVEKAIEAERERRIDQEEQDDPDLAELNRKNKSDADRIKDIHNKMSDSETGDKMEMDKIKVSQREIERQKQVARKNAQGYQGKHGDLNKFKADFSRFLANEVSKVEQDTWARRNRRYTNTPFIMKGSRMVDNPSIPSVRIYFDHSGSWDQNMIREGKEVIESIVRDYVKKKKLVVEVLYFGSKVSENPDDTGGGTNGKPIMENIRQYKPDNVIVMTDSDISDLDSTTVVPGGVFFLFKGGISTNLEDHLKGKKITRSYSI